MSRARGLYAAALIVSLVWGCTDREQAKKQFFDNGNNFLKAGKYQEAIVEFRNALQQDDKYGEARLKLAEAYEGAGNRAAAYREFIRAADLIPGNDDVQLKAATYLLLAGQFEDARTRAQTVIDRTPSNVQAQLILGNALAGMKDLEGAIREIEEAIKLDPNSSTSYSSLAAVRIAQGDKEQARAAYQKAVEVDPRGVMAWLALANFQAAVGETADAENSIKRALEIDGKHLLANRMAAMFYVGSGRVAQAEPYLKTVAESGAPAAALQLADYYVATKRFSDARSTLAPLTNDPKTVGEAETRLAMMAYNEGDKKKGQALIDGVLGRTPASVPALLLKAQMLATEGDISGAAERALAATKADPNHAQAHYALGVLRDRQRQRKEAIASFREVVRLNPRAAQAQVHLSRLTLQEGDAEGAVQLATSALSNAPGFPLARVTLVRGLIAQKEIARAEQELSSLIKQFPKLPVIYALEGVLKAAKNDPAGARASFEKSMAMDPTQYEALAGLTTIDMLEGKLPQARTRIDSRLAGEPNRLELLLLASRVYAAQRDFSKAEATLRRSIELDPSSSQAYALLAAVLLRSGRLEAARAEYDQIAQRDPKNIGAQTISAMIVQSQQKTEDARKRYETIVNADPTAAVAANNLAWLYAEEGSKLDEALRLAQGAAARLPKSAEVHDTIGWIYVKKELPMLAVPAFEKSVELAPDNPSYRYHLGMAYSRGGDAAKARAALQQALKLKPDYSEAQALLAQIKG
jgi:putative PEP-CTERM system TPR-repeat lipoprotein